MNLVIRLRSSLIFIGDHLMRMGWDLNVGCPCNAALRNLHNVLHKCSLLSKTRPEYYALVRRCFSDLHPQLVPIEDLVFDRGLEIVGVLGKFGRGSSIIM